MVMQVMTLSLINYVAFGDGFTFKKCLNYLCRSCFCSYWTVAKATAHQPNTIRHGLAK